jgi:hypothetical protein
MKRKPSPRRRKASRPARSPRRKAPRYEGPRPSPLPFADAAELFKAEGGLRLPPALSGDLKVAADEVVSWLVRDPGIGDEMTGGELLLMKVCAEKFVVHGFVLAVARYARALKRVPELRAMYRKRSIAMTKAKRLQRGLDERDAAIVAEFAELRTGGKKATDAQFDLAEKHEITDKQVRNILAAARKAAR